MSKSYSSVGACVRSRALSGCVFAAGFVLLTACTNHAVVNEPAWPEQPSPEYPGSAESSLAHEQVQFDEPAPRPEHEPVPSSSLAKKYDGKKALSTLKGKATYYADSLAGNHTANGDVYDPRDFTAAHRKLPFGTIVRVIREDVGTTTYVRVNDRGPFGSKDRIIDLSKAAAEELKMMKAGVVNVRLEIVERPPK